MTIAESSLNAKMQNIWRDNLNDWYGRTYFDPMINPIIDYLINRSVLEGNLLEIGCGFGEKANVFSKMGFNVTGIDFSKDRIELAKSNFPTVNFFQFEIRSKLPFDDNSFDVVFSNSVFQYLDHESIIKECKRILKKGGCIILIENLKNNPITRIGRAWLKYKKFKYQSFPFNHFTYGEINRLANQFNETELYFQHLLSPLAHSNSVKHLYSKFNAIDNHLLKLKPLKKLSWLTLFIGLNKK